MGYKAFAKRTKGKSFDEIVHEGKREAQELLGKEAGDFDAWAEGLAEKAGFKGLTENNVARIVMECRSKANAQG